MKVKPKNNQTTTTTTKWLVLPKPTGEQQIDKTARAVLHEKGVLSSEAGLKSPRDVSQTLIPNGVCPTPVTTFVLSIFTPLN